MKNPNGFGSVIKLSGKRRRPFAVRISSVEEKEGVFRQKFIYLDYFEKRKDALQYLSEYNSGFEVKKTPRIEESPTFEEVYRQYVAFRTELGKSTAPVYKTAFNRLKSLHKKRMRAITVDELQRAVLESRDRSKSLVDKVCNLIKAMYRYSVQRDYVEKDLSPFIEKQYKISETEAHTMFTAEEIDKLWKHKDSKDVQMVLILIYTGMRISELLELRTENIHLSERYMIGGIKTASGRNRVIPISEKIAPFFADLPDNEYFYTGKTGIKYTYKNYAYNKWPKVMGPLGLKHKTHDCRVTCATLMKNAGVSDFHRKKILGHSIEDLTDRVYTKVSVSDLVNAINKI